VDYSKSIYFGNIENDGLKTAARGMRMLKSAVKIDSIIGAEGPFVFYLICPGIFPLYGVYKVPLRDSKYRPSGSILAAALPSNQFIAPQLAILSGDMMEIWVGAKLWQRTQP